MRLYGFEFAHRPWSVFVNSEELARINPLRRVPTLVLETGEVLIESSAILDYLDEQIGSAEALIPSEGERRREALQMCALATGLADKAVALVYERVLHDQPSQQWTARCQAQICSVLDSLEWERGNSDTVFWFENSIGHADIALACALRFIAEAHPGLFNLNAWPRLATLSERCESLTVFQDISQPFSIRAA
jgi:glutathione S-transferase